MFVAHTLHDEFMCHLALIAYIENVILTKGYIDIFIK